MSNNPIVARFSGFLSLFRPKRANLHNAFLNPGALPDFVSDCPSAMRILDLIGPLSWQAFPERNLLRNWGQPTIPHAAFSAACLLKLNENMVSMGDLRLYLLEHPAFIWLLGFPLKPSRHHACGFDPQASLPTERHLTQMMREVPNASLQFLLDGSTRLLLQTFATTKGIHAGECISLDTKHILAWVKENNPKAYVETRFDKTKQPKGDPDCKLGCKRRHNQRTSKADPIVVTPSKKPTPGSTIQVGEFYWGYGSGIVVCKVQEQGEFVLAEMTQTFDHADVSYFFPLMAKTEQILGFKPRFGTFDAAFDAWYVHDYFHRDDDPSAFAAVPFSEKGGYKVDGRKFSPEGLPICAAGLVMPLKFTYWDRTISIIPHQRGKYVCPLLPKQDDHPCPISHDNWKKKGCSAAMPTNIGARLRYTLDRDGELYKDTYRQRTATERINSQAYALGIERPLVRNGRAIENTNTLIYTLINLRLIQRLRQNE
jgi:hypothetical protein